MKLKEEKYWKRTLLRSVAIFLSLIYLLHPLNKEMEAVLHHVSHLMESPSSILNHHGAIHPNEAHDTNQHYAMLETHEHALIDLISAFLGQSFSNDVPSTESNQIKIDKHLISPYKIKRGLSPVSTVHHFMDAEKFPLIGYTSTIYKPPQV